MSFKNDMKSYCRQAGWSIDSIEDDHLTIRFSMESGREQIVYIINYNSIIEFSVPSIAMFNNQDDIPHNISTELLQKNSKFGIGAWSIETIGENYVYSVMYNCTLEELGGELFEKVVLTLRDECDTFDCVVQEILEDDPSNYSDEFGKGLVNGAGRSLGGVAMGVFLSLLEG